MGAADALIFLIAALGYFTAFRLLRRMRRRDKINERIVRSLDAALRSQRLE
jgi:NO-binding membrane sensor protein with MHYT domain